MTAIAATRSKATAGRDVRRELASTVVGRGWGLLELRPMRMSLEEIFLQSDHRRSGGGTRTPQRRPAMSNILAIAHKELKGYFASPIAYVVIGLFALMFGYFFYALLLFFDRQSMQMAGLRRRAPRSTSTSS